MQNTISQRITAPLFLDSNTGLNDDLNGIEKPVSFIPAGLNGKEAEIVQSLAKWKRMMLGDYNIESGYCQSRLCMFFLRKAHIGEL